MSIRLDAHQHFWRYTEEDYGWMDERMEVIRRDFLPGDLEPLLKGTGFDGCIAVQARQSLAETEWLLELADRHDFIRGVVGWVDLRSADIDAQLARFAPHPKFVGVRHVVHDEPDDGFMLRDSFRRGISRLADHGLTYDLLLFPRHLPVAVTLVEEFPDQPFILDHISKPPIASGGLSPWREDLAALAGHPNVSCKLSGMVTEADWGEWKPADFHPYLDAVLEAFGPDRVMIGSDWPVCTLSGDYPSTMGIVTDYLGESAEELRGKVLGGNCARIYGLA